MTTPGKYGTLGTVKWVRMASGGFRPGRASLVKTERSFFLPGISARWPAAAPSGSALVLSLVEAGQHALEVPLGVEAHDDDAEEQERLPPVFVLQTDYVVLAQVVA